MGSGASKKKKSAAKAKLKAAMALAGNVAANDQALAEEAAADGARCIVIFSEGERQIADAVAAAIGGDTTSFAESDGDLSERAAAVEVSGWCFLLRARC